MNATPNGAWDAVFRVTRLIQHLGELFRTRVDLVKREAQLRARHFALGAAFAGAGVLLVVFALPVAIVTLVLVLTLWLPAWAATGIVCLVMLAVAAGFFIAARRKFATPRGGPFVEGLRDDWKVIREKMERRP